MTGPRANTKNRLAPRRAGSRGSSARKIAADTRRRTVKVQPRSVQTLPRVKYILQGFDPMMEVGTYPAKVTLVELGVNDIEVIIEPA